MVLSGHFYVGHGKQVLLNNGAVISLSIASNEGLSKYIASSFCGNIRCMFAVFMYVEHQIIDVGCEIPKEFSSRYQIAGRIGLGACGVVHLCFSRSTDKRCAVKIMEKNPSEQRKKVSVNYLSFFCSFVTVMKLP